MANVTRSGRERLALYASQSNAKVRSRLYAAIKSIEDEVEAAHYVGRLSLAAICRRAEVDPATLQKPTHKTTTRIEILQRVSKLRNLSSQQPPEPKSEKKKVDDYKARLDAICKTYHKAELELISLRQRVRDLELQLQMRDGTPKVVILDERRRKR
jgi:hypothetical protein